MKRVVRLIILLCLSVLLASCSSAPNPDSFQLIIMDESWLDLDLGYTGEQAMPILLNLDTGDNLFVIGLNEIEYYDWDAQVIRLTEDAMSRILDALENATMEKRPP
jgi:hypothetical protein